MSKRISRGGLFWRETIETQENSRLSVAEFCRQQGLATNTFYKWRRKLQTDQTNESLRSTQQRLPASTPSDHGLIELVVGRDSRRSRLNRRDGDRESLSPEDFGGRTTPKLLEVSLAGGTSMRFHGDVSSQDIAKLIATVNSMHGGDFAGEPQS